MKTSSPDSSTGAQGILQVQPETRDMPGMDPKHLLDAQNPEGSMTLGARYMNLMDRQFGRNTALSALAYVAGPQNAMAVGQNPALLDQMPQSKAALDMLTGGKGIPQGSFTGIGDPPLPRQILDAAKRGPDAFQNYVIQNASYGGQVSDGWQRVETSMVAAALMRGDLAGASHARDLVFQMSHQGMFEHLLKAKQFLDAGQPGYAATEMANSHAFVPDGVVSQYGVGKDGSIWGRRMDPHDPTKPMAGPDGQPAEITPAMVTNTLAMVSDPRGYLKFSQEQQKIASEAEKNSAMAHYYEDLNPTRVQVASIKQQGIEQREYLREQQRGVDSQVKIQLEAQKEAAAAALRDNRGKALEGFAKQADAAFGSGATTPPTMADGSEMPQAQRAAAATVMNGLLSNAGPGEHTGTSAQYIASSVVQGAFKIKQASDGREGVFDQRGNLVGMLPPGTAARAGLAAQAPASQTAPPPSPSMSSEMPSQAIH